jgi:Trypsin
VRRLKRSKIRVILGDHDQFVTSETEAIQRAVSAIIRHRNFDQNTYNHDIALLRLRKPVTFTKGIQPICLPKESIDPSGKQGTVVGWGRTSEGGSLPGILQHVTVPVLTLDQCRGMKYRASRITPNMVKKRLIDVNDSLSRLKSNFLLCFSFVLAESKAKPTRARVTQASIIK